MPLDSISSPVMLRTGLDLSDLSSLDDHQLIAELKKARDIQDQARASERRAEFDLRQSEAIAMGAAAEEKNSEARAARAGRDPDVIEKRLALAQAKNNLDTTTTDADVLTYAIKLRYRGARFE